FDKLWMIKGQIEDSLGNTVKAREIYNQAVKSCPKSVTLWILLTDPQTVILPSELRIRASASVPLGQSKPLE
ncbi:MAG: tetratricopeptide repeat protein, partial [Paenibacillus sp.]|nr:tetratricopeptide repeat protein [Paenibacillus sp.]